MILGTAGHIDHGKTALVRALTGVDTDRLPEEKRRGITIDLGFAPLRLPDGTVLGVVDVPGHEAFVRTMLAGATGIDLALLVIAADEGPMPQTREHLAILELLHVPRLVVALTKSDLVEPDWLALVTEDVRALLAPTPFAGAAIVATSIVSNTGVDELRQQIANVAHGNQAGNGPASRPPGREQNDLFRLPVDRAFTVRGTGTVVTGTVWSGSLAADDTVRIMPFGTAARVRGLQNHGAAVQRITPGMRAAVALAGVDPQALGRGATLVTQPAWESTMLLRADVTLLPDAPELRPRTRVRFHLATSDVGARVVASGSPVAPGSSRTVRVALDEPVMARGGDRFVLRSASPLATIGGGVVTDSNAARRARPMPAFGARAAERLTLLVTEAGIHGLPAASLPVRLGVPTAGADELADSLPAIARVGDRLYSTDVLASARERVLQLVRAHHEQHPLDPGSPRQDVRSRLALDAGLFDHLVASLASAKKLEVVGGDLRVAGRTTDLSQEQRRLADDLLATITAAGAEPPSVAELQERFGARIVPLLRHLERQHLVVQVEDSRFYSPDALRQLLARLEGGMKGRGELAPTDLKEVLGFSRKYLIPFLEYCDRRGYTVRQGNGRVWRGL